MNAVWTPWFDKCILIRLKLFIKLVINNTKVSLHHLTWNIWRDHAFVLIFFIAIFVSTQLRISKAMNLITEVSLFAIFLKVCKSCDVEKLYTFEVPNNHPQCKEDFKEFVNSLRSNKRWAVDSKWNWLTFWTAKQKSVFSLFFFHKFRWFVLHTWKSVWLWGFRQMSEFKLWREQ